MKRRVRDPQELLPLSAAVFHILLALAEGERHGYGIMKADRALAHRLLGSLESVESVRGQIELERTSERPDPRLVDLPLSTACKHILARAATEARSRSRKQVGTEELMLSLLRAEGSVAARLLRERGVAHPGR
jgi:ATP-dependent Clp protease ATP-binding subunit ClpA